MQWRRTTFSISAIESWANKSIEVHGLIQGQPSVLILKRPDKPDREIKSNSVGSDLGIPIRPKLFQLVPQVFSVEPLKKHSTLRHQLGAKVIYNKHSRPTIGVSQ
jgi:hypothetical protein